MNRRNAMKTVGAITAGLAVTQTGRLMNLAHGKERRADSLPMQLYKSLNDEQEEKVCLPANHKRRQFISNWWYVHPDHRIPTTFNKEQQDLIQKIFDSLHHPEHQAAVNKQVKIDQYNNPRNAPSVGFFGTPDDKNFEFIYTGHHVTRRCNAHSDKGLGFGGAPIFYGHFPEDFNEKAHHPGNPYWYQGKIFNEFVQALDGKQQDKALASKPRSERPDSVIVKKQMGSPGLCCGELSEDQQELLLGTMKTMLVMFRGEDVDATIETIKKRNMMPHLFLSYYDGKYDIGNDQVWDTWQIEGPEMVWYFRGQPHIHSYFHVKA